MTDVRVPAKPIFQKPLDSITKQDLEHLVEFQVAESRQLDYKLELPGNSDADRKEFLADVSAFANSSGGDLIFGVQESGGVAGNVVGVEMDDAERVVLRIENMTQSGLEPRVLVKPRIVEGFERGPVLIVRVPKSWSAPHMISFKTWNRFYVRTATGKIPLDARGIRDAFLAAAGAEERIQRFVEGRLVRLAASESPISLEGMPVAALHVIPAESETTTVRHDIEALRDALNASRLSLQKAIPNLKGIWAPGEPLFERPVGRFVQWFRDGRFEWVCGDLFNPTHSTLDARSFTTTLKEATQGAFRGVEELGMSPPVSLHLALLKVSDIVLTLHPHDTGRKFQESDVLLPNLVAESLDLDGVPELLRPWRDMVANAAGFDSGV